MSMIIPGGMMLMIQPLNVSVNRSMKSLSQQKLSMWHADPSGHGSSNLTVLFMTKTKQAFLGLIKLFERSIFFVTKSP